MSGQTSFAHIWHNLKNAFFGRRDVIDDWMIHRILDLKSMTNGELFDKRAKMMAEIVKLDFDLKKEKEDFLNEISPHVKEVQGHINFVLLEKLAAWAGSPDTNLLKTFKLGSPTVGEINTSGVWRQVHCSGASNPAALQKNIKFRHTPPEWMEQRNILRLWQEAQKLINSGFLREISSDEVKFTPTYGFGVEQGDYEIVDDVKTFVKLRHCFDFRKVNKQSPTNEKMRLMSHREISFIMKLFMLDAGDHLHLPRQSTKDVNYDVEVELEAKVNPNIEELFSPYITDRLKENSTVIDPAIEKFDFASYYYQWAAQHPSQNIIGIWDANSLKYRYYQAKMMLFGNLHSVFHCCRISELLSRILTIILFVIAPIYIDDTIVIDALMRLESAADCTSFLFDILGLKMSKQKNESHLHHIVIKVLGLAYSKLVIGMSIVAPLSKRAAVKTMIERALQMLHDCSLTAKDVEKLIGHFCFICYFQQYEMGISAIRMLDAWKCEKFFKTNIGNPFLKAMLNIALTEVLTLVDEILPLIVKPESKNFERVHLFTDAAGSENICCCGGILFKRNSIKAFAWQFEFPKSLLNEAQTKKYHIGIGEIFAVLLANALYADSIANHRVIKHVDNVGICHNLVNGHSACKLSASILTRIYAQDKIVNSGSYYKYINTTRNLADPLTRLNKFNSLIKNFPTLEVNTKPNYDLINAESEAVLNYVCKIRRYFRFSTKNKKRTRSAASL